MYQNIPCLQLQKFINKNASQKASYSQDLTQLILIQDQTDLINQIVKNNHFNKKYNTFSTDHSQFQLEIPNNPHHVNISFSGIQFNKQPSKFFQQQSLQQALRQIRKFCSRKTYNIIRQKFKKVEDNRCQLKLQKEVKHNKQLLKYNQQLMKKLAKLDNQIKSLKIKISAYQKIQHQNKNIKKTYINVPKTQFYLQWEKSLLYKQKAYDKFKKNLSNQFNALQNQKKQNQSIRSQLQNTILRFQQIQSNYFISQIKQMCQKINYNIQQQRKLSLKQNQDYDKLLSAMNQAVQQFKKIIQPSQTIQPVE